MLQEVMVQVERRRVVAVARRGVVGRATGLLRFLLRLVSFVNYRIVEKFLILGHYLTTSVIRLQNADSFLTFLIHFPKTQSNQLQETTPKPEPALTSWSPTKTHTLTSSLPNSAVSKRAPNQPRVTRMSLDGGEDDTLVKIYGSGKLNLDSELVTPDMPTVCFVCILSAVQG